MRPLRLLLTIVASIAAFSLLLFLGPWRSDPHDVLDAQPQFQPYLNWGGPSSLFPPSAVIRLTDDNSTFFLSRPAAFGPLLPARSMSAELWIGGGFSDVHFARGASTGAWGELGCSDVPGWDNGPQRGLVRGSDRRVNHASGVETDLHDTSHRVRTRRDASDVVDYASNLAAWPREDDGTDDYLHSPLPPSDSMRSSGAASRLSTKPVHADIQSLQESAEIAGKVVLLSRGGCGFLEKAKWVQRRGGVALIVGDDVRGGPLVTMYARGDTSNITIPSLFTSYTTAHLLSSLIPTGGLLDSSAFDDPDSSRGTVSSGSDTSREGYQRDGRVVDQPNFTSSTVAARPTKSAAVREHVWRETVSSHTDDYVDDEEQENRGWLRSLFGSPSPTSAGERSRHVGWVQEEFDDDWELGYGSSTDGIDGSADQDSPGDGFVIGVQDWRDPDLVAEQKEQLLAVTQSSSAERSSTIVAPSTRTPGFRGGSITPGSGEYAEPVSDAVDVSRSERSYGTHRSEIASGDGGARDSGRWFGHIFRQDHSQPRPFSDGSAAAESATVAHAVGVQDGASSSHADSASVIHDGLWVTLTPTPMSSTPLLDTLLVLVVSPLVTLTVVYALLLLRSRIRRRRWRAPKSVVERLPVRTYQTMPSATNSVSSNPSPPSSPVTATTPLLPSHARAIAPRARPRSRTVADVPVPGSSVRSDPMATPSLEQIEEKRAAGLAEWRRRYGGKQRECVVCLEEYVDGVSRVMSLPCGHEFHAECITPWLTTRRRTCPICKGDVVRSLARAVPPSPALPRDDYDHDDDGPDDDDTAPAPAALSGPNPTLDGLQIQAATLRNHDPDAARPVDDDDAADLSDLERGFAPDRSR